MKQENILELFLQMENKIRMIQLELISLQCRKLKLQKEESGLYL